MVALNIRSKLRLLKKFSKNVLHLQGPNEFFIDNSDEVRRLIVEFYSELDCIVSVADLLPSTEKSKFSWLAWPC